MQYCEVSSITNNGIKPFKINIQSHISNGIFKFNIVGLGDKSVNEAKERIRSSFIAIGLSLPFSHITVNLSPADLPKEGSLYDLPIATSLLAAMDIIQKSDINNYVIIGELGLAGQVNPVRAILSAAIYCQEHNKKLIIPYANYHEANLLNDIEIIPVKTLFELLDYFKNGRINRPKHLAESNNKEEKTLDYSQVNGHFYAKRALEIAAIGKHNLIMLGPPGSGKSMLAERLPSILPDLNLSQAIETTSIISLTKSETIDKLALSPPFRSPHHTASAIALAGGGKKVLPGEISLAHNGILFLDELPEFSSKSLEILRQPLENKKISIARAEKHTTYPADFQLIAAMNPCKCGKFLNKDRNCTKAPECANNYFAKISGPIMDRIDIQIIVEKQNFKLSNNRNEPSSNIKQRILAAREFQTKRQGENIYNNNINLNQLTTNLENELCLLLNNISEKYQLSHRSLTKIMRVARSIADLELKQNINKNHILEALHLRIGLDKILA